MTAAINRYLPVGVHFDAPQGGLFLWVRLPDKISSNDLLSVARKKGVDFVPGSSFFPDSTQGQDWIRLNFVLHSPDEIEMGIKRLGTAIEQLAR